MSLKNKQVEALCYSIIDKYKPLMFLDAHIFTVKYDAEITEEYFMWCEPKFPYFDAIITYGDSAIEAFDEYKNNKKEQRIYFEPFVIHEMAHVIMAGLIDKAKQRYVTENEINGEFEKLTDYIMKIILNLCKQNFKKN